MKHFSYLVTIVLIMVVALTQGFAAKGTAPGVVSVNSSKLQQSQGFSGRVHDSEIRTQSAINKNAHRVSDALKAQTSSPIPKVDNSSSITSGLSGLYHIPGDFTSIGAAVAVLNYVGISGAVTFQLDNATYSEPSPITFGAFPSAGTATVTVQPKAGLGVTINFVPSASAGKGFAFNGTNKVTIDGLNTGGASLALQYSGGTFPVGDGYAATIYVTGGSQNVTVQNASIKGQIQTSGAFFDQTDGRPAVFCYQGAGTANANITVSYCTITNATFGLKAISDYTVGYSQGPITYSHNNVGGAYGGLVVHGGLVDIVAGMHYDYNVINGVEFVPYYWENGTPSEYNGVASFGDPDFLSDFGQQSGGHFYTTTNGSTVSYNQVSDVHQAYNDGGFQFIAYGLLVRLGGATGTLVHDNRITGINTTDADGIRAGLRTESGSIHNSINLTGPMNVTAGQTSYCLRAVGGTTYNNALSNTMTNGAGAANRTCLQGTPGGVSDGNAFYSTGGRISPLTLPAYFGTGKDAHSQFGPIGFDATMHLVTFPSSAEDIGQPRVLLANDVDGTARDTTGAGVRDAGADEVLANSGSATALDVLPTIISPPNSAGEPFGLPVTPKVGIKNNSTTATGSFNLTLTASDGYSDVQSVSLAPLAATTLTFAVWSPAAAGTYTMTATSALGGDAVPANDVLSRSQTFTTPTAIVGDTVVFNSTTAEGWVGGVVPGSVGAASFVFSNAFSKARIGGPYSGYSWVTGVSAVYTSQTGHTVTSPFYNLASLGGDGNVYFSFYQALATEPSWDRSWIQYSTNGTTWNNLGVLNDPNGVNWYSTAVYANAAGSNVGPDCWDGVTAMVTLGLTADQTTVPPGWTSNGDCSPTGADVHTGPTGYIYTQLKITPANYPAVVGAPIIKFRFVAFADGSGADDGWAIDDLRIGGTAPPLLSADIGGNVYTDTDGSGTKNGGETGTAGLILDLTYFGVHVAFATSDVNGDYIFPLKLTAPGSYKITIATGLGLSQPAAGSYTTAYTGNGTAVTGRDFGLYNGAVTGKKFDDVNDNGADNSEPGLSGWTIELHRDSCNGLLLRSGVTAGGGLYSIPVGPGTYYVKEVLQAGWRSTTGICVGAVTVSGTSGSGTAIVVAPSIGNFKFASIAVRGSQDANGNGVYNGAADDFLLPGGVKEVVDFKKNTVHVSFDTLGNGSVDVINHTNLDVGSYTTEPVGAAPATWIRTLSPNPATVVVATSGQVATIRYMDFQLFSVSGHKFEDHNGNGTLDGGDQGLAGWKINLVGTSPASSASATTDVNGDYTFTNVGPGSYTLSEVVQAGWTKTVPATSYSFGGQSRALGGDITGQIFGNFKNISISGLKYRDRNGNGSQDGADNGLDGWTINGDNGLGAVVTAGGGLYSYSNVGPGTFNITETAQAGYLKTEPVAVGYVVIASSGVNVTGLKFGNYQQSDDQQYRTWTVNELKAATEAKAVKRPKPTKPYAAPTSANLLTDLLSAPKSAIIKVGLAGQFIGGKEKGYVQPAKQGDAYKTFNNKGQMHVGNPKPLSFDNSGLKRILKRQKSLVANKVNDILAADLLALRINLAASNLGQTSLGLGNVLYCEASNPIGLARTSINQIADDADALMTNWDIMGQPGFTAPIWVMYDTVVAKINAAFSTGLTTDITDSANWHSLAPLLKLKWKLKATAQSVAYLCAPGPGIVPSSAPITTDEYKPIPDVYALSQNYPNPFNPTTTISFDLPEASIVTLTVYNILGQEIATLLNHESLEAGSEEVDFDASALTSGVYFYRITAQGVDDDGINTGNTFTQVKKMMLVK